MYVRRLERLMNKTKCLYKGVFWIKNISDIAASSVCVLGECDKDGNLTNDIDSNMLSKKGDNFNHKKVWKCLDKYDTDNKPYDYYPRGRVEIRKGAAIIYVNPNLLNPLLKEWVITRFGLTVDNGIKRVLLKVDGSEHYKCYLD